MSTRSTISILNQDGTITQNYCHSDGHPAHVGAMLLRHHNTAERVAHALSH